MRWRIDGRMFKSEMAFGATQCGSVVSLLSRSWPPIGRAVKTIEVLLAHLAVAGVEDHVPGVGVDPGQAGDFAGDAGPFLGLAYRCLGERFARVHAAAGTAQLSLSVRRIMRISPWSLTTITFAEGTMLVACGASGSSRAIGACCHQVLSARTIKDIRDALRAALANAVAEELLARNVAAVVRLPNPRKPQRQWWSVEEARAFLESARRDHDLSH